jgi:hypothetical protein
VLAVVVAILLVGFPAAGFLSGRRAALALPVAGWPLFYVGLNRGWWLDGTGDGWERAAAGLTFVGVSTTAIAVAAGRALRAA